MTDKTHFMDERKITFTIKLSYLYHSSKMIHEFSGWRLECIIDYSFKIFRQGP